MTQMVQLTWGDALVLKVHRSRVGLKPYVDAIQAAVGKNIGTRPTFAKLYDAHDVESMSEIERYRAWLLLTAMGEDPGTDPWGIPADVVPPAADVERLRQVLHDLVAELVRHQGLEPRTRWFDGPGEARVYEFADNQACQPTGRPLVDMPEAA